MNIKVKYLLIGLLCCLASVGNTQVAEATDSPETLQWVEKQAQKIDSLLDNAILSHEPINLIVKLTDAYLFFDAVSMTGLYCPDVQNAAHTGRNLCDVVNFKLEKDMNSAVTRAALARQEAARMLQAARMCQSGLGVKTAGKPQFTPLEVVKLDAEMVVHDLADGMAAGDFHILSQKIENAIRILYEIDHLAATLERCDRVRNNVRLTILAAEKALGAPNWTEANKAVQNAIEAANRIEASDCQ